MTEQAAPRGAPALVALDGPGGSGKSTVARALARALGYGYLDTGATYRALTLAAIRADVLTDHAALVELAAGLDDRLELGTDPEVTDVRLDGTDVSADIRGPAVTAAVSAVAAVPGVRRILVAWQRTRALRAAPGCVLEGRDTGSVVVPEALLKVWLTAEPAVRAFRRGEQDGSAAAVDLRRRDGADATRSADPMRPAPDAVVLDSSGLDVAQTVARLLEWVRRAQLARTAEQR